MSRIDIAELNDFLHGLRSSNAEAKAMIRKIKEEAMDYAQDNRLKGKQLVPPNDILRVPIQVFARASLRHWMKAKSDYRNIFASSGAKWIVRLPLELMQKSYKKQWPKLASYSEKKKTCIDN